MNTVRAVILLAGALLVALTAWMVWQVQSIAPPQRDAVTAARLSAALAAAQPPAALQTPPRVLATVPPLRRRVESCDIGSFPALSPTAAVAVVAAVLEPLTRGARTRLITTLDSSADEYDRAVGHYIAWAASTNGVRPASRRDALAALAATTHDARVYRLAIMACLPESSAALRCRQLSNAQWARLDADNAMPWLFDASDAAQRGDADGLSETLFRASQARVSDVHLGEVARLLQRPDIAALPAPQRLGLELALFEIWGAMPTPGVQNAIAHCRDAALDYNRQQLCSDLATLFVERDSSVAGLSIGLELAELAGWNQDRRRRIARELDAMEWAAAQVLLRRGATGFGCDWSREQDRWTADLANYGERGALQRVIVEDGRSIAELAGEWREARRPRHAVVEAAR